MFYLPMSFFWPTLSHVHKLGIWVQIDIFIIEHEVSTILNMHIISHCYYLHCLRIFIIMIYLTYQILSEPYFQPTYKSSKAMIFYTDGNF